MSPATGEQIVALFRTWDHDNLWAGNWSQGPDQPAAHCPHTFPGSSTTIQGVLSCVDLDTSIYWLLMLCDSEPGSREFTVSYLCTRFNGDQSWPWMWVRADDNIDACRKFIDQFVQLDADDEDRAALRVAPVSGLEET